MSSSAPSGSVTYPYSLSFQSNASVAIIIVVLGATFFFMFLFVVYIKRCNSDTSDADGTTTGGTNGGWSRQQMVHGLDPEVLQKFPIMRYASVKGLNKKGFKESSLLECAVCLGQFEENEQLRLLPACGHLFHPECIDMWLQSHSTCPLCRRSLSRDAVSGHLQRALAAVTSSFRMASSPEGGGGGAAAAAAAVEADLEAQDGEEGSGRRDILGALSRNSESFKMAAHEVAVREVRDKLRATSSSGRFGGSSPARMSSLRATPSRSSRREGSIINPSPGSNLGGETPLTPIACGIHHSQSYSELRTITNSPYETLEQHKGSAELMSPRAAEAASERWTVPRVLASLRRSASTSSSSRVASSKL